MIKCQYMINNFELCTTYGVLRNLREVLNRIINQFLVHNIKKEQRN